MPKIVGGKAYVHRRYLNTLPEWAKEIVIDFDMAAGILSLPMVAWNVIRVGKATQKEPAQVALMLYYDFEGTEHPELIVSTRLYGEGERGSFVVTDTNQTVYAGKASKPILHRKELLVDRTHPDYIRWEFLTSEEEAAGLLSRRDIGNSTSWKRVLEEAGYKVLFNCLLEVEKETDDDED